MEPWEPKKNPEGHPNLDQMNLMNLSGFRRWAKCLWKYLSVLILDKWYRCKLLMGFLARDFDDFAGFSRYLCNSWFWRGETKTHMVLVGKPVLVGFCFFGTMPKNGSFFFLNFGGLYINNQWIFDHLFSGDFNDGRKSLDFSKVMKKYRRTKSHEKYVGFCLSKRHPNIIFWQESFHLTVLHHVWSLIKSCWSYFITPLDKALVGLDRLQGGFSRLRFTAQQYHFSQDIPASR